MENKNNGIKKGASKFVAWIVALSLLATALMAGLIAVFIDNKKQKLNIENIYESRAYQLYDSLSNLEMNLSKLMISSSRAQDLCILMDTYRQAEVAQDALSSLPISYELVGETSKFLNQVADWCKSYNGKLAYGADGSAFTKINEDLYITIRGINAEVGDLMQDIMNGKKLLNRFSPTPPRGADKKMTHNSVEYPELIYDGPFSDGGLHTHFKALEGKNEITGEQAEEIVAKNCGIDKSSVKCVGKTETEESVYELSATDGSFYSVTVRGGLIINFNKSRALGKEILSEANAKEAAQEFAAKLGYDCKPVWYNSIDGVACVNLAPIIDDTVFYPDLIKVKVALDNGDVLGLEASGFCKNNCVRTGETTIDSAAALKKAGNKINVISVRKAVIPFGTSEVLCYEIAGEYKGLSYFVYIDAKSGESIKILRVVDEKQGKLTI